MRWKLQSTTTFTRSSHATTTKATSSSKRRYSRREKYAIPYNGEEVYLHWANSDQYYVKTSEYFTHYTYKAPNGVTVYFELRQADIEKDNVKGDTRYFIPLVEDAAYDEEKKELVIPFEYRPLTKDEAKDEKTKNQDALIKTAIEKLTKQMEKQADASVALGREHLKDSKGEPVSYLKHHLTQYTKRNTSDYFIHKEPEGFPGARAGLLYQKRSSDAGRPPGWQRTTG